MEFKLLKELDKDFKIQLEDYYESLYDYDWDDYNDYDYNSYWDDELERSTIKLEYLTKRNGCYSKKILRFGRKIDLMSYYSTSILREKKIEALLDGKPLNDKNYLDNFLNEESKRVLYNFKIKISQKL